MNITRFVVYCRMKKVIILFLLVVIDIITASSMYIAIVLYYRYVMKINGVVMIVAI